MIKAAYFTQADGQVSSILTGPSLEGMPEAPAGQLATLTDYSGPLPAYWDGAVVCAIPDKPSPSHVWNWLNKQWESTAENESAHASTQRIDALSAIDDAAGRARLKYITSVPGQSETYQRKEQQAREWQAAGFAGNPPSFVNAEAIALGADPQAIALNIIALAEYWSNIKGPEIEAVRLKGKADVTAAGQDLGAINAALSATIDALGVL